MRPTWYPDWSGQAAVVVASGPSAGSELLHLARGRARFLAVNESWRLCPWADALFASDFKWWENGCGCPDFGGLKVTIDRRAGEHSDWGVYRVQGHRSDNRIEFDDHGHIGGGNSGLNAINLAVQFYAKALLLVGFDMRLDRGLHWHGKHPEGMKNPLPHKVERWRQCIDNAARPLAVRGIRTINCSPISALRKYPKMDFVEALEIVCPAPAC